MDRRAFLRQSLGFTVAGTAALGALAGCGGTTATVAPPGNAWNELARMLSGELLLPGSANFATLALPNNLRYAGVRPAGIALCANASDVGTSLLWAQAHGVPLVARSGGHSYGGYSTTTGLMIDVAAMNAFAFDSATGIATLGAGARNRDVYAQGRKFGFAITHGRCLNVGVVGLALGGGVGFNMRAHGLTCDQLTACDIVTADGRLHTLRDPNDDDGLLWACRGAGGGNFGIVTSMEFQTFTVDTMTAYDLTWETDVERIFPVLVAALEAAPVTLGCKVSLGVSAPQHGATTPPISLQLLGQLAGTPAELEDIIAPALGIARPKGFVRQTSYWDAQNLLSELGLPEYFHESSRFYDGPIAAGDPDTFFSWLRRWPATVHAAAFKLFQTGGRVNAVAPAATSFVHRNSEWLSSVAIVWERDTPPEDVRRNLEWQQAFYAALVPLAGGGAYQNFIDPSLADWKTAYYGTNLPRLETIKRRVDPHHVFRFPEAIP
ncbi:MAG: FAD-binding oxidoreductase [Candidatus Eremiobacteraeota bacterium]|nr:FAD-binding oxidoreductase [Candidatus Eremiobacteraeota bacterium]